MISVEHMQELIDRFNSGELDIRDIIEQSYFGGRADAIDECIKLVGGNVKTIVGVIFDNSIPIHDRALGRMAKNKLVEELVEQLEQLKENKS